LAALAIALGAVALELAVSSRYGYHRDELYFLECGRHLAWGYVDQPPLTPAVGWAATHLFGSSLTALRLFPALSMGALVTFGALIARELGGGRFAQILAALGVALAGEFLGASHLLSPTPFDQLSWVVTSYLVIRLIRTGRERLWLAVGLTVGIGLLNKWTIAFFVVALAAGLVATREQRWHFGRPWLWAGVVVGLAIWAPNLLWQADHGWPFVEMSKSLHREAIDDGNLYSFIPAQLIYVGPLLLPVWVAGLWWLARSPEGRPYRAFAWAYALLFAFFLASLGKAYYIGPMYGILLPAGAVATERYLERRRERGLLTRRRIVVAVLIGGLLPLPIALPILPAATLATVPLQAINYDLGETIGWPRLVDKVSGVYRSLPPSRRATAVILTSNYGEAGAVDRFGPALGLPPAYSGHNNYYYWGPPAEPRGTTIGVGFSRRYLERFFRRVKLAGRIHNGLGVDNDEQGAPVWLARGPKAGWATSWPRLRHYD
jgi:Dolichyl-phosphate-mannose-protein mannosyltransferase